MIGAKFSDLNMYWRALVGVPVFLVISRYLMPSDIRIEDYQEIVFLVVVVHFYFLQKFLGVGLSKNLFFALLIFWLILQARVFLMRELGYYNGKVLIVKLAGDSEGYKARALARGIKTIGRTYHLSGPSLIPYELEGRDIDRWFSIKMRPALIIFGSTSSPVLELPISQLYSQIISEENFRTNKTNLIWLEKDALNIKVPLYDGAITLPLPPSQLKLEGEDSNVMKHYIGWLSGFFHPDLSRSMTVRQDTIHEAAKIDAPWKSLEPRALARYLKSMEEVFEIYPHFGKPQISAIQVRLSKVLQGLEKNDLYCSVQSFRAYLFLTQGSVKNAKKIFTEIVQDENFSERQRAIAAKNLGTLELG